MTDRLFLCGLDGNQRSRYPSGHELNLHGPKKNIRLNLDSVRSHLLENEPPLLTDLAEIASYVFAADCAVRRGGLTFPNVGAQWRRRFHMVIAVRNPGAWSKPAFLHALRQTLEFLSDDTWLFEFVQNENPAPLQTYFSEINEKAKNLGTAHSVVLFSGGLDSYAGAIHELAHNKDSSVTLVSRRIVQVIDRRQDELAQELKKIYGDRVSHIPIEGGLTIASQAVEHTQRTRSFLLAAIAQVVASIEGADRIRFFENGIMSINLPISTQVVGTRASRSTHPRSLLLLQSLVRLITESQIEIDNPFLWLTKTETLRAIRSEPERQLIHRTISCSRTRELSTAKPHCGTCAQCIQRRISTLASGLAGYDPDVDYEIDLLLGQRQEGEARAMALDTVRTAFELCRLSREGVAQRFVDELSWAASGLPNETPHQVAKQFVDLFHRYGSEVRNIFVMAVHDHPADIVDRTFPANSLMEFVVRSDELEACGTVTTETDSASTPINKVEQSDDQIPTPEIAEFRIAIDEVRKRVRVEGLAPITGSTEYMLMNILIDQRENDLTLSLAPENYSALTIAELVDQMSGNTEDNIRKAVSRIRKDIAEGINQLGLPNLNQEEFIETLSKKAGYRLGQKVRIVRLDQLRD